MRTRTAMLVGLCMLIVLVSPVLAKDPPGAERFILSGVIFVDGGRGMAWVQEPTYTQNQVITVRPGDMVGPYRLTEIFENGIELQGPAGKIRVPLSAPGAAPSVVVSRPPEHTGSLLDAPKSSSSQEPKSPDSPVVPDTSDTTSASVSAPAPAPVTGFEPSVVRERIRRGLESLNVKAKAAPLATTGDSGTGAAESVTLPPTMGGGAAAAPTGPGMVLPPGKKVEDIGSYLLRR